MTYRSGGGIATKRPPRYLDSRYLDSETEYSTHFSQRVNFIIFGAMRNTMAMNRQSLHLRRTVAPETLEPLVGCPKDTLVPLSRKIVRFHRVTDATRKVAF